MSSQIASSLHPLHLLRILATEPRGSLLLVSHDSRNPVRAENPVRPHQRSMRWQGRPLQEAANGFVTLSFHYQKQWNLSLMDVKLVVGYGPIASERGHFEN